MRLDTEMTRDQAIDRFNEDMSNSIDDGDRNYATMLLAKRIGDSDKAEDLRSAWMAQYRDTLRQMSR